MNNKQKLLDALKGVPMLQKDKEEFVNIICNNNKSNSEDYYGFYKINESDLNYLTAVGDYAITNIFIKIGFNNDNNYYLKPFNELSVNSGFAEGD